MAGYHLLSVKCPWLGGLDSEWEEHGPLTGEGVATRSGVGFCNMVACWGRGGRGKESVTEKVATRGRCLKKPS